MFFRIGTFVLIIENIDMPKVYNECFYLKHSIIQSKTISNITIKTFNS